MIPLSAHSRDFGGADKWYDRLEETVRHSEAIPLPWVDRPTLEFVLGGGRRRPQQILAAADVEQPRVLVEAPVRGSVRNWITCLRECAWCQRGF